MGSRESYGFHARRVWNLLSFLASIFQSENFNRSLFSLPSPRWKTILASLPWNVTGAEFTRRRRFARFFHWPSRHRRRSNHDRIRTVNIVLPAFANGSSHAETVKLPPSWIIVIIWNSRCSLLIIVIVPSSYLLIFAVRVIDSKSFSPRFVLPAFHLSRIIITVLSAITLTASRVSNLLQAYLPSQSIF